MRVLIASAALAAAFVLMPAAARHAPAWSQDFSITNPDVPADGSRRDVMRQLQAWWVPSWGQEGIPWPLNTGWRPALVDMLGRGQGAHPSFSILARCPPNVDF